MSTWNSLENTASTTTHLIEELRVVWSPDLVGNTKFLTSDYSHFGSFILCWKEGVGIIPVLKHLDDRYTPQDVKTSDAPFSIKTPEKFEVFLNPAPFTAAATYNVLSYSENFPILHNSTTYDFPANLKRSLYGEEVSLQKIELNYCQYYPGSYIKVISAFEKKDRPTITVSDKERDALLVSSFAYLSDQHAKLVYSFFIARRDHSSSEPAGVVGLTGNTLNFNYISLGEGCKDNGKACGGCTEVKLVTGVIDSQTKTRKGIITVSDSEKKCWKKDQYITIYLDPIDHCNPSTTTTTVGPTTTVPPFVGEICASNFNLSLYDLSGSWSALGYAGNRSSYSKTIMTNLDPYGNTLSYYRALTFRMFTSLGDIWYINNETDNLLLEVSMTTLTLGPTGTWTGFLSGLAATVESPC